jgi:hypothetical protein
VGESLIPDNYNYSYSDGCQDFVQLVPSSNLQLKSGMHSSLQMAAYTSGDGISTLRFNNNAMEMMRVERGRQPMGQSVGSFSLTVPGSARIAPVCPPICNTTSSLNVLASNSSTLKIAGGVGGSTRLLLDGSSSVLRLRQVQSSSFMFEHRDLTMSLTHRHDAAVIASTLSRPDRTAQTMLEVSQSRVTLTGEATSDILNISDSSVLGSTAGDPMAFRGSLALTSIVAIPRPQIVNATYNISVTDPVSQVCVDQNMTRFGMGNCTAILDYIGRSGKTCLSTLTNIGIPGSLAQFCPMTCVSCPDKSTSSQTILFLPRQSSSSDDPVFISPEVLTSVSATSALTDVGSVASGSIVQGFGSISTSTPVATVGQGYITAAGVITVAGPLIAQDSIYLGGQVIQFLSFSSVAARGAFSGYVELSASRSKLALISGSDKRTTLRGNFDAAITESTEPTCPFYLNADGSICVLGQRDIVIPDILPSIRKSLLVISHNYGSVNDVNQVYMAGTCGEIESHPGQLVQAGHASYLSVYNSLVTTSSIVLAQISNPGVGGIILLHAVTTMTMNGGFTVAVRNIDPVNTMLTTYKVSYVVFV